MKKPKLALYWAASCGGCDVAVLDTNEKLLDIAAAADIVLWPVAVDLKYHHLEALGKGEIDITLFNGAIRNSENEHIAKLLREKSKVMVAFGSCACFGGIPGLANMSRREDILGEVYLSSKSVDNPGKVLPEEHFSVPEGILKLPYFDDLVRPLSEVAHVDYVFPGCPPAPAQISAVLDAFFSGNVPEAGATVGVSDKSVCDECQRKKEEKKITKIVSIHEVIPDTEKCFLEQGIICAGSATAGGCGTRCINSNMPCRGCYGPTKNSKEHGARLLNAVASIVDSNDPAEIAKILGEIQDPAGTFYRFTLASSYIKGKPVPV